MRYITVIMSLCLRHHFTKWNHCVRTRDYPFFIFCFPSGKKPECNKIIEKIGKNRRLINERKRRALILIILNIRLSRYINKWLS
jgi:hypothetical protein